MPMETRSRRAAATRRRAPESAIWPRATAPQPGVPRKRLNVTIYSFCDKGEKAFLDAVGKVSDGELSPLAVVPGLDPGIHRAAAPWIAE
jgi:hypothetical protein